MSDPRGTADYPHASITSFDGGKHSSAELHERGESSAAHLPNVWHDFAKWYSELLSFHPA